MQNNCDVKTNFLFAFYRIGAVSAGGTHKGKKK